MIAGPFGTLFADLTRVRDARSARASSWDPSGRNHDAWTIGPGETAVLADLEGPGCITHIWMTQHCLVRQVASDRWIKDPDYYRKVLLRIYWDDAQDPGVLAPLGDFFCLGHSIAGNFASLPFSVSAAPEVRGRFGGNAALNCYFQMPFGRRARVEVENQNDRPYRQYFYVDYELYREPLPPDVAYFHAQWRRQYPCDGWAADLVPSDPEVNVPNLDGNGNYVILEAEGRGHYVGCNLSVTNLQGTWWGEGDDMCFIDGEAWPPSLHGTGSEDYFNQAWGMQENAYPMNGSALYQGNYSPYQVSYRFHLTDPIRFTRSLRVTMEHGHANHLANDWCSTAYWYQTLPAKPFDILPVAQRLPIRHADLGVLAMLPPVAIPEPEAGLTPEMRAGLDAYSRRQAEAAQLAAEALASASVDTARRSAGNVEQARWIRQAYR